jgi:hypothetical protein
LLLVVGLIIACGLV